MKNHYTPNQDIKPQKTINMNIGIINTYHGKSNTSMRLDQMLADICRINPDNNTTIYQSTQFKPEQIQQDKLDYILTFGGTKNEDDFVEDIHNKNQIPILYLLCPGNTNPQQRYQNLTKKGIETHLLANIEELMMRLMDIGRYH